MPGGTRCEAGNQRGSPPPGAVNVVLVRLPAGQAPLARAWSRVQYCSNMTRRGVEALNDLVRSWPETETFRQAAELLGQADRTLAEVSLTVVAEDVNAPIQQRFTAASHLVSRLDAEPDLLLSLVMSRDIERESSRPTRALIVESGRSPPIPWLGSVGKHPGGLISDACVRCRHGDVAGQLIHGDGCFGLAQATPSVREHLTATRERGATQRADRRSGDPSRAVDCRRRRTVVLPWKPLR